MTTALPYVTPHAMSEHQPDPVVHVKVPRELHEEARVLSIRERRSLASVVVLALEEFLAKRRAVKS